MILLTDELRARLLANGRERGADHVPVVKFFNPLGEGVWLASELDADGDTLFGLADIGEPELGSFSLVEMSSARLPFGMGIERDILFTGDFPLSVWAEAARGRRDQGGRDRPLPRRALARATGLDMVEAGFRPTAANYLGRVTKPRILEAVREALGEDKARLIDHLKKDDMAREAERLLADTGWLPEPLRPAEPEALDAEDGTGPDADLPAFLAGDDEADEIAREPDADAEPEAAMIAAE